jgi:hypothetical protein
MADPAPTTLPIALVQLIGQLAWPLALLAVIWRFRNQIQSLLTRVASVKVGGSEWVFQEPSSNKPVTISQQARSAPALGPDGFVTVEGLHALVSSSGLLVDGDTTKKELVIFQTPRQRTWLLASRTSVYVILDDKRTRRKRSLIQTYFSKDRALPLDFGSGKNAGIVKFAAESTWWYYSLHLFPTTSKLQHAIERLVL